MNTVLIIDDDPDYRKFMGDLLKQRGWQVLEAENGDAGIELAEVHRPDVVLSDLLMASGNGFQVCRALRSNDDLRHTKIVVVSGRHFEKDRQAAFKAGADEYVTKPIDADRLVLLLSRIVGAGRRRARAAGPGRFPLAGADAGEVLGRARLHSHAGPDHRPVRRQHLLRRSPRRWPDHHSRRRHRDCACSGSQLVAEFETQPIDATLLLTHTHWDHIQGLPFFQPVYKPQNHLRILGFEGARHGLEVVLAGQMESPFFPIGLREVPANVRIEELKEMSFNVGPVRVEAAFANHPGICVGYRLFTSDGSIAFFPDNEPFPESAPPSRAAGGHGASPRGPSPGARTGR